MKGVSAALGSHITPGISLNFATDVTDDAKTESWGTAKVERLRALRKRLDPERVFRLDPNVRPSVSGEEAATQANRSRFAASSPDRRRAACRASG